MKSGPGDEVVLHAPGSTQQLQVIDVRYERIPSHHSRNRLAPKPRQRRFPPAAS